MIISKKHKEQVLHTKYAYENPKETLHESSNPYDMSRMGKKKMEETARAPNEQNKYDQEPHRIDKNHLLTDTNTTEEPVKAFINWYGYKNPV